MRIKLEEGGQMPTRAHSTDAGLDLYVRGQHDVTGTVPARIPLGVCVEIPAGHMGLLVPRSGLLQGRDLYGQTGIIDSDYRGELQAVVVNTKGPLSFERIDDGDRLCQLVVVPVVIPGLEPVNQLEETPRGIGGFGSTGTR